MYRLVRWNKFSFVLLVMFYSSIVTAELEDNADYRDAFQFWAGAHLSLLPTSFLPGTAGAVADISSIAIDVRIKFLPPSLITQNALPVIPNSNDGCYYSFNLPQKEAAYSNLFGLADIKPLTTQWGALSQVDLPVVEHANAQVELRVNNEYLDAWTETNKLVVFPSGNHTIKWSANTQFDPILDYTLPIALFMVSNEMKYYTSFFEIQTNPATAARALEIGGLFLINAGIELGLIGAGEIDNDRGVDTATHIQNRTLTVYDVNPPLISTSDPTPLALEANSLGGERWEYHAQQFRSTIQASDPCDQPLLVGNDAPVLLPLGDTVVTWQAIDTGPLGPDNAGVASVTQTIRVEDTRPPILLAPPSRVIESDNVVSVEDVEIGSAVVFDVADPDPLLQHSNVTDFQPNTRTELVWTATDSSGNSQNKSQWVTVKTPGSNTAPLVNNVNASGLTSESIDIQLTGTDSDMISGQFDPLKFKITQLPEHGFFISPLVPYFIEDYRVRPGTTIGDILNASSNPSNDIYDTFCVQGTAIPTDFVYQSEFVLVDDQSTSYVLDKYWVCDTGGSSAVTLDRLSKWNDSGELLSQIDVNQSIKRITIDENGFIYTVRPGTNSDELFMTRYDTDLISQQSWKLDTIPGSLGNPRLLGAKMDTVSGLIYATDKRRVYVFDGNDGQFHPAFLGTLKNAENFLSGEPSVAGSSSRGFYIEVDSTGAVYVEDSGLDRIHKFTSSHNDANGFSAGEYVGWLGRCDSGPGCDDLNGRSFGYSCNESTPCTVIQADGSNCGSQISGECSFGDAEGQFHTPLGMVLDPGDILYVTDYENSRVQRFTPDGSFAGVAQSSCDGTCFVLGDMGMPLDISVNADKFYVLDQSQSLLHVFETAPFKDITDQSVTLSYASDNDFQGVDQFSFIANDGLVSSQEGHASITISRNFRPPESLDGLYMLDEDTTINIELRASDPDGISGVDFNGLDTLVYEIIQNPTHGNLVGSGNIFSYTPDLNFNGSDQLTFRVSDGVFQSDIATVVFDVQEVNDVPAVQFIDETSTLMPAKLWPLLKNKVAGPGMQAGLGYSLPLIAEFTDPDVGQAQFLQIGWGDGTFDTANQLPPADPDNPPDNPIITTTFNSTGQIVAKHTYMQSGINTINLIVLDQTGSISDPLIADVEVIPMVDLSIENQASSKKSYSKSGQLTTLNLILSNQAPESPITPMDATNVEFTGTVPDGVQLVNIQITKGVCSHQGSTSTCQIGTVSANEEIMITVTLLPDLSFDPEQNGYVVNATSNEPDASFNNLSVFEIPVDFETIFRSGFED